MVGCRRPSSTASSRRTPVVGSCCRRTWPRHPSRCPGSAMSWTRGPRESPDTATEPRSSDCRSKPSARRRRTSARAAADASRTASASGSTARTTSQPARPTPSPRSCAPAWLPCSCRWLHWTSATSSRSRSWTRRTPDRCVMGFSSSRSSVRWTAPQDGSASHRWAAGWPDCPSTRGSDAWSSRPSATAVSPRSS